MVDRYIQNSHAVYNDLPICFERFGTHAILQCEGHSYVRLNTCSLWLLGIATPFSNGYTSPMTSQNESYHNDNFSNKTEFVQEYTLKIVFAG